ncbi:hypothetical protein EYF80_045508 [Liparis tanakae]|uniref:Uncharacterized protein n=1 Tax=Liparis tanakae TaxID=230148 RepID=A0A4Z2FU20_9TELE|nr:hypothetical protein EYF80_045508 [Liparis tanakae]
MANTDARHLYSPRPPFFSTPLPPFYVGVGALGAPYSCGVPSYISDPRAESLNQSYGIRTSVRETATADSPALREEAPTPRGRPHRAAR